jgi:GT2 family glycosyltransferase
MTKISVIIPAYGLCPYLADLVAALSEGVLRPDEIIISHSGSDDPTEEFAARFPTVIVLHHTGRLLGGAARNQGAAVAKGEWLVFIDADVRPAKNWLASLAAHAKKKADRFFVGSVGYATTGGYWGMCNWLTEFSEQAPWRPARVQQGGASCNMMVAAQDFHRVGGFPEDYQPGEDTAFFSELVRMGRTQWFASEARVDHHNQSGFSAFVNHQFRLGYHSALVRQQYALRGAIATRVRPLAFVLWIPKLALLGRRLIAGGPTWWLRGTVYAPGLIFGSWVWTAGFVKRVIAPERNSADLRD